MLPTFLLQTLYQVCSHQYSYYPYLHDCRQESLTLSASVPPFTVKLLSPFNQKCTPKPWVVPTLSKVPSDARKRHVDPSAILELPPCESRLTISLMGLESSLSLTINNLFSSITYIERPLLAVLFTRSNEGRVRLLRLNFKGFFFHPVHCQATLL